MAEESGSAERKGLIYEAFVACAVEGALNRVPEVGTKLSGVIADQDVIWPNAKEPKIVISVTHWGSHEAAKMKFWRIHEDFFEVKKAFPNAVFLSVVFDRNQSSDANLCTLLDVFFSGCGISDLNCSAIRKLQNYVSTAAKQRQFGFGFEAITAHTKKLLSDDKQFAQCIDELGELVGDQFKKFNLAEDLKASWNRGLTGGSGREFRDPGSREVFFKPALIVLMDIGSDVAVVFSHKDDLEGLPEDLKYKLLANGAIEEDPLSLTVELQATDILKQLIDQGQEWCEESLNSIQSAVEDSANALYAYHDHVSDITDTTSCEKRIAKLIACKDPVEVRQLLTKWGERMIRCWPVDYAMAIQRKHVKAGEYGLQRLSEAAGIEYVAGGISPIPLYIKGNTEALSSDEIERLSKVIFVLISGWEKEKAVAATVQRDRKITLMKKLSVLDLLLQQHLSRVLPDGTKIEKTRVRHPVTSATKNRSAGATDFNLRVQWKDKQVFIFVAATYETTHKHKELSGRLRGAKATGDVRPKDLAIVLADGNLFYSSSRTERINMMRDAGWDGAYFLNELEQLGNDILSFIECQ